MGISLHPSYPTSIISTYSKVIFTGSNEKLVWDPQGKNDINVEYLLLLLCKDKMVPYTLLPKYTSNPSFFLHLCYHYSKPGQHNPSPEQLEDS